MKSKLLAPLLSICLVFSLLPAVVMADGDTGTGTEEDPYIVTAETTTLEDGGFYKVESNVTVNSRIMVNGTATLILGEGATLNANKGIGVPGSATLTIDGTGSLVAKTDVRNSAAIGGTDNGNTQVWGELDSGAIIINNGNITATGGNNGAGIGSGEGGRNGSIVINNGKVTATGGTNAAGIGTGANHMWGSAIGAGIITINGGEVIATGGGNAPGIGAGRSANNCAPGDGGIITINGGKVTATGGKIGGGKSLHGIGPGAKTDSSELGAKGTITLSCTSTSDSIKANGYVGNVSIADVCALTDGTNTYFGKLSDDQITAIANKTLILDTSAKLPKFEQIALILDGQIGMKFYANLSILDDSIRENIFVEFTVAGRTITDDFNANDIQEGLYGFTCPITSAQMDETITAKLKCKVSSEEEIEYSTSTASVEQYCAYIAEHQEDYSESAVELAMAIADYGYFMTPYIREHGTGVPADKEVEYSHYSDDYIENGGYDENDYGGVINITNDLKIEKTDSSSILTGTTYKLLLGSETTLCIYFKAASGTSISESNVQVCLNGNVVNKAVISKDADGRFTVKIPNLKATDLSMMYDITITDDSGHEAYINASAFSYIFTVMTKYSGDALYENAMTSLFLYSAAAQQYAMNG